MCVQYIGGYHENIRGVHFIGGISREHRGCSVHRADIMSTSGDIMMHVGEQGDKSVSMYIENSDVLNIPRCTHDIPPMC